VFGLDPDKVVLQQLSSQSISQIRSKVLLVDGGVRDNLGLVAINEVNAKRRKESKPELDVLVSDGARRMLHYQNQIQTGSLKECGLSISL